MSVGSVLGFILLPVQRRDLSGLSVPWGHFVFTIAAMLHAVGLLKADDRALQRAAPGEGGLYGAATRATAAWLRLWRDGVVTAHDPRDGVVGLIGAGLLQLRRSPHLIDAAALLLLVWCAMAGLALGGLSGAASLLSSTAYAAGAVTASADVGAGFLKEVFPFLGGTASSLSAALASVLYVLSLVATTLAGIGALWGALVMLIDAGWWGNLKQAGHNPWWFFMRVVFALALLAPLTPNGYGAGQKLLVAGAQWGSEKATQAWSTVVGQLGAVSAAAPPYPLVEGVVRGVWLQEVCRHAVNNQPGRMPGVQVTVASSDTAVSYDRVVAVGRAAGQSGAAVTQSGACGRTAMHPVTTYGNSPLTSIRTAHKEAFDAMRSQVAVVANRFTTSVYACINGQTTCGGGVQVADLHAIMLDYNYQLRTKLDAAVAKETAAISKVVKEEGTGGWALAGTWANRLATANAAVAGAAAAVPDAGYPTVDARNLPQVGEVIGAAASHWVVSAQASPALFPVAAATSSDDPMSGLFGALSKSLIGLIKVDSAMPLADMAMLGQGLIAIGFGMLLLLGGGAILSAVIEKFVPTGGVGNGLVMGLVPGGTAITVLNEVLQAISPTATALSWLLLVAGATLAYIVPATPAIRYLLAVVAWGMALLEAVILVPLVLVTMITTEGSGLFSQTARAGLWQAIALMARPILTLAGFLGGLLLTSPCVWLLNQSYLPLVRDASTAGGTGLTGAVTWTLLYAGLCYAIVNSLFKLAETLPHSALRWVGQQGSGERDDFGGVVGPAKNIADRMGQSIDRYSGRGGRQRRA